MPIFSREEINRYEKEGIELCVCEYDSDLRLSLYMASLWLTFILLADVINIFDNFIGMHMFTRYHLRSNLFIVFSYEVFKFDVAYGETAWSDAEQSFK